MTTDIPAIDRDKSPLLDADHDAVRIADALRSSPHITYVAPAAPGDERVWFRDADGTGFELSLAAVEPDPDGERVAYAWDAVVAAIGNHRHFIHAALEQPSFGPLNLNTITALTRTGNEYTLTLTACYRPCPDGEEEPPVAVADLLRAVGQLRSRNDAGPDSASFAAAADLLEHIAGAWDQQDDQMRQRALTVASALTL